MRANGATGATNHAERFHIDALGVLVRSGVPFMLGGGYAIREYTGIMREKKDMDFFCEVDTYPRILQVLAEAGYANEITYPHWLAKAFHGEDHVDIIFSSGNGVCRVDDRWFRHARELTLFGFRVKLIPPEEMIWSKAYVQDRQRFDGADIAHIMRAQGPVLDWRRLLEQMGPDWELLLAHIINFRFVYPSERETVPHWLLRELWSRIDQQLTLPEPHARICRGPLLSLHDYEIDVTDWGYQDVRSPLMGGNHPREVIQGPRRRAR